ncbi:hypothetical protein JW707_04825 [Candidatus Woesearchaeota archaeon]|nr:hypothetical protein [Candidatus Woesearchaeota archaeon]
MSFLVDEAKAGSIDYRIEPREGYVSLSCSFKFRGGLGSDFVEEALEKVISQRSEQFPTYVCNSNGSAKSDFLAGRRRRTPERANYGVYIWRQDSATSKDPFTHISDDKLKKRVTDANVRLVHLHYNGHNNTTMAVITADAHQSVQESEEKASEAKDYMMALCREVQEALGISDLFN